MPKEVNCNATVKFTLDVPCPKCDQAAGAFCVDKRYGAVDEASGKRSVYVRQRPAFHTERLTAFEKLRSFQQYMKGSVPA